MRTALVVFSMLALALVIAQSVRLPESSVTRWATFCLIAQILFTGMCLMSAGRMGVSSLAYARTFYSLMAAVAVTAIIFSVNSIAEFPAAGMGAAFFIGALTFVILICASFIASLSRAGMLNWFSFAHVACAGMLLLCGILTLTSLAFPDNLISDYLRGALGTFWLLEGIYGLAEPALYLRGRAEAVHQISAIPTLVAIVVFSALALFLSGAQRELSRQHDEHQAAAAILRG